MGIGVMNVLMVLISMFLIDRLGRKTLLIIGSIGTLISLGLLSVILFAYGLSPETAWVTVGLLCAYIVFFQGTWGPIPWIMMPEIFPARARGAGTGFSSQCVWATNLLISLVFPIMLTEIGAAWTFSIFAFCCLVSLFFAVHWVPETKGRSLEKIESDLRRRFVHKQQGEQEAEESFK